MYSIDSDILKTNVQAEAFKRFQDAEDHQTIILHMINPIKLEQMIFEERYQTLQAKYLTQTINNFKSHYEHAMKNCREFINSVQETFEV